MAEPKIIASPYTKPVQPKVKPKVGAAPSADTEVAQTEEQTTPNPLLEYNPTDSAVISDGAYTASEIADEPIEEVQVEPDDEPVTIGKKDLEKATKIGKLIKDAKTLDKDTKEGLQEVYFEASAVLSDPEATPAQKKTAIQQISLIETYLSSANKVRKEIIGNKNLTKQQKIKLLKDLKFAGKQYLKFLQTEDSKHLDCCNTILHTQEFLLGQLNAPKKLGIGKNHKKAFTKQAWQKYGEIRQLAKGLAEASDPNEIKTQISEFEVGILQDYAQTAIDFYGSKNYGKNWQALLGKAQAQLDEGNIFQALGTLQVAKNIHGTKKQITKLREAKVKKSTPQDAAKLYKSSIIKLGAYIDKLYAATLSENMDQAQVHLNGAQKHAKAAGNLLQMANKVALVKNAPKLKEAAAKYIVVLSNNELREVLKSAGIKEAGIDAIIEDLKADPVKNGKKVYSALQKAENYINLASAIRVVSTYGKGTEMYDALLEHAPKLCEEIDLIEGEVKKEKISTRGMVALARLKHGIPKAAQEISNKNFAASLEVIEKQLVELINNDDAKDNPLPSLMLPENYSNMLNTALDFKDPYKNDSLTDLLKQVKYYKNHPGALKPKGQQKFLYGVSRGKAVQEASINIEQNQKMLAVSINMGVQVGIIIIAGATAEFGGGALVASLPVAAESVAGVTISLTATSLIFMSAHRALSVGAGEVGLLPETDWWASPAEFFKDWATSFAMFGVLRGMGGLYVKGMGAAATKAPATFSKLGFAMKNGTLIAESTFAKALYKSGALATEYAGFVGFSVSTDLVFSDMTAGEVFSSENIGHHAWEDAKMLAGLKIGGYLAKPILHPVGQKIMQKAHKPLFDKMEANQKKALELYEKSKKLKGTLDEAIEIGEQQIEVMAERLKLTVKMEKKGLPTESSESVAKNLKLMEAELAQLKDRATIEHNPTILAESELIYSSGVPNAEVKAEAKVAEVAKVETPKEADKGFLEDMKKLGEEFQGAWNEKQRIAEADTMLPENVVEIPKSKIAAKQQEAQVMPLKKAAGSDVDSKSTFVEGKGNKYKAKVAGKNVEAEKVPEDIPAEKTQSQGIEVSPKEGTNVLGKGKIAKGPTADFQLFMELVKSKKPNEDMFKAFYRKLFEGVDMEKSDLRKGDLDGLKKNNPEYKDMSTFKIDVTEQLKAPWEAEFFAKDKAEIQFFLSNGKDIKPEDVTLKYVLENTNSLIDLEGSNQLYVKLRELRNKSIGLKLLMEMTYGELYNIKPEWAMKLPIDTLELLSYEIGMMVEKQKYLDYKKSKSLVENLPEGVDVKKTLKGIKIEMDGVVVDFGNVENGKVQFHGGSVNFQQLIKAYYDKFVRDCIEDAMKDGMSKEAAKVQANNQANKMAKKGVFEKAARKNIEAREAIVKQGVVVKVGDAQAAKSGATPPPAPKAKNVFALHNDETTLKMFVTQAFHFRFKGTPEKFEIFRAKDGRFFLRNSKGEVVDKNSQGKDGWIFSIKGEKDPVKLVIKVGKDGEITIKDSSTKGILIDKHYHNLDAAAKSASVKPMTVDELYNKYQAEGKEYLQFIQNLNIRGQAAGGIERPLDIYSRPGALVKLSSGKKAILIADLHANIENLNLILKKYAVEIEYGEVVLVFLGDAIHPEVGYMKDMASSIKLMDAIIQLTAEGKAIYLKGNHDEVWGGKEKMFSKDDAKGQPIWQGVEFQEQFMAAKKAEYVKTNPQATEAEANAYAQNCVKQLQSFYDNAPLIFVGAGIITGHTPVLDSMTLAMSTTGVSLEHALINAHHNPEMVMALTWGRPEKQSSQDHPYKYNNADAQSMREELNMPEAVIVAAHSHHPSGAHKPVYVTPGIDKGLTIMSSYGSNLSVIEVESGVIKVEGVKGNCDLNGQSIDTTASAAAAQ